MFSRQVFSREVPLPTADGAQQPDAAPEPARRERAWSMPSARRFAARHGIPLLVFAGLAVYLLHGLILHPGTKIIGQDAADQTTFEWMLSAVAQQVAHFHNPLFSAAMNAPRGVNLMANPSVPLYGVLLTPLTLAAGATASFVFLLVFNPFAAATAWYWFFLRHPETSEASPGMRRGAAAIGGLLCGFSPAMAAHSYGHPNLTAQWLVPLIADRVLALRVPGRSLRTGAVLGLLVAALTAIAEELVFITGLTLGLVILFEALARPRQAWRAAPVALRGAGVAAAVAGVLLAYPLWFQFKGPGSYTGAPWASANYEADAKSYFAFSQLSLAGAARSAALAPNITEESAFVGWPLLLIALAVLVWRFRESAVRSAGLAAVVIAVLSLGSTPMFGSATLRHKGPWSYLAGLPLFADALPVRLSFAVFPLLAYILVIGVHRFTARLRPRLAAAAPVAAFAVVAAALLPIAPRAVTTQDRPAAPAFYADGLWRQCVGPGKTLVAFPFGFTAMRWAAVAGDRFPIVGGDFFGPGVGTRAFGTPPERPTQRLLTQVDATGAVPAITATTRLQATEDAAYWRAGCVALFSAVPNDGSAQLNGADLPLRHPVQDRLLLTELFGPGKQVGGVWTWRIG
ncbi:hypothetical protein [Actinocrinis sp.]|uniref:hypothetical protein n=1 Tax=Actinocrinis sp. TaxID=1920516 RepID=UPI002D769887|nr:hypothetical protein [Actinocrinis sp.]